MDTISEQMNEINETPLVWEDPTTDKTTVVFVQTPEQIGEVEEDEVTAAKINSTEFPRVQDTNNFTH